MLYLKKGDTDGISSTLKKLIDLYTELGKVEKIAFTNYRFAIALYQQRRYQDTIDTMKMALEGGYHHNNCYKCIALSYAYLGDKFRAEEFLMNLTNSKIEAVENLQSFIDELRSQVTEIFSSYKDKGVDDEQILHEIEGEEFYNDFMFGLNTRAESFFIDRYGTNPVGIKSTSLDKYGFREVDVNRLEDEGANHKVRESMGFYGTAAFIENQINGNSTRYYDLLSKCARAWGIELQGNGQFNSAAACFEFSMENENRNGRKGEKNALRYLFCILRKRSYDTLPEKREEIAKLAGTLINQAIKSDVVFSENSLKEVLLLIEKSSYIQDLIQKSNYIEKENLLKVASEFFASKECIPSVEALFSIIKARFKSDENKVLGLANKIRTSKAFNDELLAELRSLKSNIFSFDVDSTYIDNIVNAFEKGIEIYDYDDYDNRMASIINVQNQLDMLYENIEVYPSFLGINYLREIIEVMREITRELSKKTRDDLCPELFITIPLVDIPIIEGYQNISITITNKENSASAKDVKLSITDVEGDVLLQPVNLVQYLKGGKGVSREFAIPAQEDTYTIKVLLTYNDHENETQIVENMFSISTDEEDFDYIESPYFTGDSIDASQASIFFGRDLLLDTIENALRSNKSSCEIIYGQKRCGKSSIANFLEDRLKNDYIVIKFSIGAARKTKSIYLNIKDLIVEKVEDLIYSGNTPPVINQELLNEIEERNIDDEEEFVSFIRFVHRKVCRTINKEILLMIDEFTHLYRNLKEDRSQVAAFMDTWKKLLEADLFKAVLIGQDTMPNFIKAFQNQFQVTDPIRVDRLDDESVRRLISDPLRLSNGKSRFMENSVDLIAGWFYGQPYYIQLYCNNLVDQMNKDRRSRVTNALAEKVKENMLDEADIDLFDNLISRGDDSGTEAECYEILKTIATLTRNSEWANIDEIDIDNKNEMIDDLLNRSVIRVTGKKCKILIPFFKEWLNLN